MVVKVSDLLGVEGICELLCGRELGGKSDRCALRCLVWLGAGHREWLKARQSAPSRLLILQVYRHTTKGSEESLVTSICKCRAS